MAGQLEVLVRQDAGVGVDGWVAEGAPGLLDEFQVEPRRVGHLAQRVERPFGREHALHG